MEIISLKLEHIDKKSVQKISNMLSNSKSQSLITIDLGNVKSCVVEFFEMLSKIKPKISLINVDSHILAGLYMTGYDKFVRVFEDEFSLYSDKHEIINRRFSLI